MDWTKIAKFVDKSATPHLHYKYTGQTSRQGYLETPFRDTLSQDMEGGSIFSWLLTFNLLHVRYVFFSKEYVIVRTTVDCTFCSKCSVLSLSFSATLCPCSKMYFLIYQRFTVQYVQCLKKLGFAHCVDLCRIIRANSWRKFADFGTYIADSLSQIYALIPKNGFIATSALTL